MEEYKSPVYNVIAVPVEKVVANTYIIFRRKTSMNWSTGFIAIKL